MVFDEYFLKLNDLYNHTRWYYMLHKTCAKIAKFNLLLLYYQIPWIGCETFNDFWDNSLTQGQSYDYDSQNVNVATLNDMDNIGRNLATAKERCAPIG